MGIMLIVGILSGILFGRAENVSTALLSAPEETVKLILSIGGLLCFWSGIMKIAEKSGILKFVAKILRPILSPLFPDASEKALAAIVMNIAANLLGLGNAATPMGLIAMKELYATAPEKGKASAAMINFVIFNTVGLQIIPTTVGALRKAAGSEEPFSIMLPMILVSCFSLAAALSLALIFNKIRGKK